MDNVHIVWNEAVIELLPEADRRLIAAMDRFAAGAVIQMKALCPVSPVGPYHRSGQLRSSIRSFHMPDHSYLIGPTESYGRWVNDGSRPHIIRSHGPWSLHNRESGRYFGRVVHHPGSIGRHFVEQTAAQMNGVVIHA